MAGHLLDLTTLADWLKSKRRVEELGGLAYLGDMASKPVTRFMFSGYLEILRNQHRRRWALAGARGFPSGRGTVRLT